MGRLTVHTHGAPKDKAMKRLIDMYGERIQGRGIGVEHHPARLSATDYVDRLTAITCLLIYKYNLPSSNAY